HLDIIVRATKIFDQITIAICHNKNKKPMFTLKDRIQFVKMSVLKYQNINKIIELNDLLANFAKKEKIKILIRGVRTIFDFDYEIKLNHINKHIYPELDSVFFLSSKEYSFISSSFIKELIKYKGNIKPYLPKEIYYLVVKKINNTF
ncbi:pantetheine-phosphate adenylyltransferase, partial [Buchnera aphidicola]|nr:pantetheine-phosphate adenylyltransferase [Buchnera aphidicola]